MDVAENAATRKIEDEVAFTWRVLYTLRNKATIMAAVKGRARRRSHKYSIEIPQSVEDASRIDKETSSQCGRMPCCWR